MACAQFRFYEELNDFLPPDCRKRAFEHPLARAATVKHAIEALGVPHTEVEVILVNGESVGFSHRLQAGDRVAVYPRFESFDIAPLLRVRPAPLRVVRFIADVHLGRLARYLRLLGFDTVFEPGLGDAEIARRAAAERRVVLTRDRGLLKRRIVTHGCLVRATRPLRQLEEILERLQLHRLVRPFTLCTQCNHPIEEVAKDAVADRLEPDTARYYERFYRCPGCDRIYWEGSHYDKMCRFVDRLLGATPQTQERGDAT
ncbi:MAG: Mut7-C ubiquitin/RNAse domain-containing protein [Planctomycetes bacterium]|nr:Mut7-C ubiquitin/RNAse domain-containing protein [Planctomycetota bacterium]